MIPFVDLKAQYDFLKNEVHHAMNEVIEKTAFVGGSYLQSYEKEFAEFCNTKHCVGVANGTDALTLILKALDIKEGDEVITVPNTFIATTEAISNNRAIPRFVDVCNDTMNLDPTLLERITSNKVKAIIPVHLYGQPAQMDKICEIAKRKSWFVIEDAAQAHGAKFQGKNVGSFGIATAFSFYPGKNLGAYGDGGAVITNDTKLSDHVRMLANHGRTDKYEHQMIGVNSRLDSLQAAILRVKLKYLSTWNEKRRKVAALYHKAFDEIKISYVQQLPSTESVFHLYVIRVKQRDQLRDYLQSKGIQTGIHYPIPLHLQPAYRFLNIPKGTYPIAETAADEILSLPMFAELSETQVYQVVSSIKEFFQK